MKLAKQEKPAQQLAERTKGPGVWQNGWAAVVQQLTQGCNSCLDGGHKVNSAAAGIHAEPVSEEALQNCWPAASHCPILDPGLRTMVGY